VAHSDSNTQPVIVEFSRVLDAVPLATEPGVAAAVAAADAVPDSAAPGVLLQEPEASDEADNREEEPEASDDASACPSGDGRQRLSKQTVRYTPEATGSSQKKKRPALAESAARGAMLACIPEDAAPDMNTKFDSIASALQPFGYALPSVSERFNAKGGPELALLK
jgi:hypothetical protein